MHFTSLFVHIAAGSVGIISGFVALYTAKGAVRHRSSGMIFVYAMLTMALMGSAMAAVRHAAPEANVPIGLLTSYLVITGLSTVKPVVEDSRSMDRGLMALVFAISLFLLGFGFVAVSAPKGTLGGIPSFPFFIFGAIGLLAGAGDARLLRAGGVATLRGRPKLARHLWRMTTALLIAAFSFFLGQAKVIPKPMRIFPLLAVPPVLVLVTLFYWMWRVRSRDVILASAARRESALNVVQDRVTESKMARTE